MEQSIKEKIAFQEYEKVGDDKLFPSHTDKDIWVAGFVACLEMNSDLLKALEYVQRTISESEAWWMDCPNKGGFDTEIIDKAINKAYGNGN